MSEPEPDNVGRLIAGLAIAVGVLVLGLSGTCTAMFIAGSPMLSPVVLIVGGPFILLGGATVIAALHWFRPGRPADYAPMLAVVYSIASGLAAVVGIALMKHPSKATFIAFALAGAFGLIGWRISR